jgi:hypothetical protein
VHAFDAIKSFTASQVVALWLMPQYCSVSAPDALTASMRTIKGCVHAAAARRCKQYAPCASLAAPYVIGTHLAVGVARFPPMHSESARHVLQLSTLPFAVAVHVFVLGLQLFPPQAVSFSTVHCTHVPAAHTPLPLIAPQSASTVQGEQAFVEVLQSAAAASLQSVFPRQATQALVVVLQTDFVASLVQSVLFRHPTQVFPTGSQTGFVASLQSVLLRHATHLLVAVSQTDVEPLHFPLQGAVVPLEVVPPLEAPPRLDVPPPSFPAVPPTGQHVRSSLQENEEGMSHA